MDCKMTDIIAIISSIIAIGYSIYSIITKSYIRQYNLEKFEHFSLNQKKVCIVFNFIMKNRKNPAQKAGIFQKK